MIKTNQWSVQKNKGWLRPSLSSSGAQPAELASYQA